MLCWVRSIFRDPLVRLNTLWRSHKRYHGEAIRSARTPSPTTSFAGMPMTRALFLATPV